MEVPMTRIQRKGPEISDRKTIARRQFLRFLAGSPLLTATSAGTIASVLAANAHQVLAQSYDVLRGSRRALGPDGIITAPADALDVFEFEPAAKKAVLSQGAPAHWGYLESGVEGDVTRDANHAAYARYNIRVRRLIDARKVDTSVKIFSETWASPIFICPVSSLGAYQPEAGVAVANYSITSSAREINVGGTVRPSALSAQSVSHVNNHGRGRSELACSGKRTAGPRPA